MYKQILVPIDLADTDLAKPAIETAVAMARASGGSVRLVNVLPMTPVMLAEYVPPDFDVQQRKSSEEAHGHHRARMRARRRAYLVARCGKAASITRCWKRRKRSTPT